MSERKMVTYREIDRLSPIAGADAIELAHIGGWQVVVKKGEFEVGDEVAYFEIDSWIPHEVAPFLSKGKTPAIYNGVAGARLKSAKIRGALSQGLVLPVNSVEYLEMGQPLLGDDISKYYNVQKWEPMAALSLAGQQKGLFPAELNKTDQERVQNLSDQWFIATEELGTTFEVTEKLDGTSATYYLDADGGFHVCSRNFELKEDEGNFYWKIAKKYRIEEMMREIGLQGYAVQGEIIGPQIQGNKYGLKDQEFFVFDIQRAVTFEHVRPNIRTNWVAMMGLQHVPVLESHAVLKGRNRILEEADGQSMVGVKPKREGVVWKAADGKDSFKAISNAWLLKNE